MPGFEIKTTIEGELDFEKWMDASMEEVLRRSKERAPVRTGRLRDSLTLTKDDNTYSIGTDVEYGSYQEFGTALIEPRLFVTNSVDELPQIMEEKKQSARK